MTTPKVQQLDEARKVIRELVETINKLEGENAWLTRQMFGRRSEKLTGDLPLFPGLKDEPPAKPEPEPEPKPRKAGGKRKPIPDDLPRVERIHDLPDSQKYCPVTGELLVARIGEEVSEQLEYKPGSIRVIRHIRIKYVRKAENLDGSMPQVVVAAKPDEGLPKCLAGPSLLAQIGLSKFGDHLPLYRLEGIFKRSGVHLPRSSMCRWMQGLEELMRPLLGVMKQHILASHVIQSDDTPVRQQAKGKTTQSRFWSYCGDGITGGRYILYDYTLNRSRAGPEQWFSDESGNPLFAGHLQCDAYSGYAQFFKHDDPSPWRMTSVGCWAHARRKFHDVRTQAPGPAHWMIARIGELYDVERECREQGATPEQRQAMREAKSKPIVDTIVEWCSAEQRNALPKSGLGKAIGYLLNQQQPLRRYLADGRLEIDNNGCERSLRAIALGRKNWLFTGSEAGGKAAAALFSVIGSCKLHDVEPLAWLTDVITRLPSTRMSQLEQFLPDRWKAENTE